MSSLTVYLREKKKVKLIIARRDNYICCFCKKTVTSADWTIEHIVPRCIGGSDAFSNLKIAHEKCNNLASAVLSNLINKFGKSEGCRLYLRNRETFTRIIQ